MQPALQHVSLRRRSFRSEPLDKAANDHAPELPDTHCLIVLHVAEKKTSAFTMICLILVLYK